MNVPKAVASSREASNELRLALPARSGYYVRFEVIDPAVENVEIRGLGPMVQLPSGAKEVFVPPSHGEDSISYTVKIRPGQHLSGTPPVRATLLP